MRKLSMVVLVFLFVLAGCSSTQNPVDSQPDDNLEAQSKQGTEQTEGTDGTESNETTQHNGYVFEIDGVSIAMHAEAAPILEQLDGPKDYFESEACAFPGLEKVYQFDGFDLYTFENNGVDYIASVVLFDDTIATKEGVYLFDKKENIFQTYGDDYKNRLDLYTYEKDRSQLIFLVENDVITSIEYLGTLY